MGLNVYELKTKVNDASVMSFLGSVEHPRRREDAKVLLDLFCDITGEEPKMWGASIVGFGTYHYVYKTGQEGDWPRTGFSPRKQNLSIYIMPGLSRYEDLLGRLGKHKVGKSCLYINKLADVDMDILRELIHSSLEEMARLYPDTEA